MPNLSIVLVIALLSILYVGAHAQPPTPTVTFAWDSEASVALFHRYCFDTAQQTECSSGTLAPLGDANFDIVAIAPLSDLTSEDLAFLDSRDILRPVVFVLLGLPPDGTSLETFINTLARAYSPDLILVQEANAVAGVATFITIANPVGGKVHGDVPVAGFAMNPAWAMKTGDNGTIPAQSLRFMDSNLWEDAYIGFPLFFGRMMFAGATFAALVHGIVRVVQSFKRDLPMKIFPLTLRSSRPIALWTNLIGVAGRLLFMMIDPMSATFRVSSTLSNIMGVFGVPWTIVTAVIAIGAWLYAIRKNISENPTRILRYQIVGLVFSSIVILLTIVSIVVDAAQLNSLRSVGTIYYLAYCAMLVACSIVIVLILVRMRRITKKAYEKNRRVSKTPSRILIRGIIFIISTVTVLLTFVLIALPVISGDPIPNLVVATAIAWALAFCSSAGVELFDYRSKETRSTRSGTTTSSGSTVTTLGREQSVTDDHELEIEKKV